jgi:hypothetical protein
MTWSIEAKIVIPTRRILSIRGGHVPLVFLASSEKASHDVATALPTKTR